MAALGGQLPDKSAYKDVLTSIKVRIRRRVARSRGWHSWAREPTVVFDGYDWNLRNLVRRPSETRHYLSDYIC